MGALRFRNLSARQDALGSQVIGNEAQIRRAKKFEHFGATACHAAQCASLWLPLCMDDITVPWSRRPKADLFLNY